MANIRGIAQPFIRKAVSLGMSANQAYDSIRSELGTLYRRSDFLADFRQAADLKQEMSGIRNINRTSVPTERLFKTILPAWEEKYEYRLRVTGTDQLTGQSTTKYVSYRSNDRLSRNELTSRVRSIFQDSVRKGSMPFDVDDTLIVEGYQNGRLT